MEWENIDRRQLIQHRFTVIFVLAVNARERILPSRDPVKVTTPAIWSCSNAR